MGLPARGYSWEPFKPGDRAALRHGAHSRELVSERAQIILAELVEKFLFLQQEDGVVLDVLCEAKARHDILSTYIDDVIAWRVESYPAKRRPRTGVEGVPERIWQQVAREGRTITDAASKLGLTATDRARLLSDLGLARKFAGQPGIESLAGTARKFKRLNR